MEVYIQLLRIIACFFVIVNHTNSRIFLSLAPSATWFASLTYFFVSKVAVPVFVMISGAMLLGKQNDWRKHLQRVLRLLAGLVLFSGFYHFMDYYKTDLSLALNPVEFLLRIIRVPVTNAFWYLYMYLGLLLMLPILQRLAQAMSLREYRYLLLWSVPVLGICPIIVHYLPQLQIYSKFALPLFVPFMGMFFAGYYIHTYAVCTRRRAALAACTFIGLTAASVLLTYSEYLACGGEKFLYYDNSWCITISGAAVSLFYLAKCAGQLKWLQHPGLSRIIVFVGQCTFGIYLLSDYWIEKLTGIYTRASAVVHPLPAVLLWEIAVFAVSFAITVILRHIPYVKKLL